MDLGSVESKFSYCLRTGKLIPGPFDLVFLGDELARTKTRAITSPGLTEWTWDQWAP
jgi:hypothetical protein